VNVIAVGAHPDDIELGCAGALLRHVAAGDRVTMLVMTTGERGPQGAVPRVVEQEQAARIIGADLVWGGLADGGIAHDSETVGLIDDVVRSCGADIMYTHAPHDTHQDHVNTSACSVSAARKLSRVLFYQAPSTSTFEPTVFVDVADTIDDKITALRAHRSQVLRCDLVDLEAIEAASRYWGYQARMRHAEAFETPRFVWDIARRSAPTAVLVGDTRQTVTRPRPGRFVVPSTVPIPTPAAVATAVAKPA
jgi:LmbE family N-acetylglucosaminyl deacetylase